jgi:quercetin dioxygenase-like cupin family protein
MAQERLFERDGVLVVRAVLEPGETSEWHTDDCHRVSVVLAGDRLAIESRDGGLTDFGVTPGEVSWDEPTAEIHRAVNVGRTRYEEVVTFFLADPGQDPQPKAE